MGTGSTPARVLVAVAAAAAVCAASADAKGPTDATVCGASHCVTVRGAADELLAWQYVPFSSRAAPSPAPFYSIRLHDPSGITWVLLYVPHRHAVRIWQSRVPPYSQGVGPYWRTLPAGAERAFERVVRGLAPRNAARGWQA